MSERVAVTGSHVSGAATKWLGCLGGIVGSSCTILELNIVATKLAGKYKVATVVNALIDFESFAFCSPYEASMFACVSNVPNVWHIAALMLCIRLLFL